MFILLFPRLRMIQWEILPVARASRSPIIADVSVVLFAATVNHVLFVFRPMPKYD